jgi:chromosome segregation ATPase
MLPDEMEAEKNRKIIVAQADEINILKNNIKELQEQLNAAHKRIKELTQARDNAYDDISNLIKEDLECR